MILYFIEIFHSQLNVEKSRVNELQTKYNDVANTITEQNIHYEEDKRTYDKLTLNLFMMQLLFLQFCKYQMYFL